MLSSLKCKGLYNAMSLLSYFDKSLETFVFGHQVLVEVYSFIVAAAKPSIHPLHAITIGSREL